MRGSMVTTHNWLQAIQFLPVRNGAQLEIDQAIVYLAAGSNDDDVCYSCRPGSLGRVSQPGRHVGLTRLVQRNNVEEDMAMSLLDDGDCSLDLVKRERVEGVGGC